MLPSGDIVPATLVRNHKTGRVIPLVSVSPTPGLYFLREINVCVCATEREHVGTIDNPLVKLYKNTPRNQFYQQTCSEPKL